MTSLADAAEDRVQGLIWHGRFHEAEKLAETMADTNVRKHVSIMYIRAATSIAVGTIGLMEEWKESINKVLEICAGDGLIGGLFGAIGGMFSSPDESADMLKWEKQAARGLAEFQYALVSFQSNDQVNGGLYIHSAWGNFSSLPETVEGDGVRARFIRSVRSCWLGGFNLFLSYIPKDSWGSFFAGVLGFETDRMKGLAMLKAASKEKGTHCNTEAKLFLTIYGLIEGSQDFIDGKDDALKGAFQRMQATCKSFGKAPMFHWMTSQLARVAGDIDMAMDEMNLAVEGFADIAESHELTRAKKELAWCTYIKGGSFDEVAATTEELSKVEHCIMRAWVVTICAASNGMMGNRDKYVACFQIFETEADTVTHSEFDKELVRYGAVASVRNDIRLAGVELLYLLNQMNLQKKKSWYEQWMAVVKDADGPLSSEEDAVRLFLRSVCFGGLRDDKSAQEGYLALTNAYEKESKFGGIYVIPNAYFLIADYQTRSELYKEAQRNCQKAKAFSGFLFQKNFSMKLKSLSEYIDEHLKAAVVTDKGDVDDY
jgi:hypothetical protein|eukprot:Stramenopile-MAST_4_protein_2463